MSWARCAAPVFLQRTENTCWGSWPVDEETSDILKIVAYIHPNRTLLPCSGIGRHINNVLLQLASRPEHEVALLFAREWLEKNGRLPENAPLRDLPFRTFPMRQRVVERSWKLLKYPKMDRWIPDDADVVYCPMETCIPVRKCPVAVTIHDVQAFEDPPPWAPSWKERLLRLRWRSWVRRALRVVDRVLTVSEFSKRRLVELAGTEARKVVVVGNGVEPAYFGLQAGDAFAPLSSVPYALVIGGLRRAKGAEHVLRVAAELRVRRSGLRIVVVGEPSEPLYVQRAQALGNVTLLGLLDDVAIQKLLGSASSLLILSPYEGFGIPAAEAMAAGIPVVAAKTSALPETVGEAGVLVDPEAAELIAHELIRLQCSLPYRERYINLGRARARNFEWRQCADRVDQALRQLCRGR
jgi:glycosyltransferase involved in cell wall biosynthesis